MLLGQLPEIGFLDPGQDEMGGYVPLDPLQPDIGRKDLLDARYQVGSLLVLQGAVLALLIQPVQLSSLYDQGGIDLEVVGAKAAV